MKSVPQGGIKWRPGGEILWNSRQVGSRNMRVGKRIICGIMAGILFMVEPVSGYGMMREGTWKKDIRNQIMEIQQMQPELTPYTGPEITAPSANLMEASTGAVICRQCHKDHDADPDLRRPAVREDPSDRRGDDKRPREIHGRLPGVPGGGRDPDSGNSD